MGGRVELLLRSWSALVASRETADHIFITNISLFMFFAISFIHEIDFTLKNTKQLKFYAK